MDSLSKKMTAHNVFFSLGGRTLNAWAQANNFLFFGGALGNKFLIAGGSLTSSFFKSE